MTDISQPQFLSQAGRIINAQQAACILFAGNVGDIFYSPKDQDYQLLPQLLASNWSVSGRIVLIYELNGPIRFNNSKDRDTLRQAWISWRSGIDGDADILALTASRATQAILKDEAASFEQHLERAIGRPTVALELLRQFCCCSRHQLSQDLVIIIEAADLMLPDGPVTQLNDNDRHRLSVCLDWFSDPGFSAAGDIVVLLADTASGIHQRIRAQAEVALVDVADPDEPQRDHFIRHQLSAQSWLKENSESDVERKKVAQNSAGLSLLALRQLLRGSTYYKRLPTNHEITLAVQQHITARLGDDVVDFIRPNHYLSDVVGFHEVKDFLQHHIIPRFKAGGDVALTGAAVGGPIGAGKTFLFEAFAAELELPVLVLKNIRSKWYGGTDIIIEHLRSVLSALERAVIFIDEADTMFGSLDSSSHETERRLTGKIQAMMSDPRMKGRVFWLLMTARVHRLSPDIRRPGRVGDVIIPILDPTGQDRRDFVEWLLEPTDCAQNNELCERIYQADFPTSAADFAALRSELKAEVQLQERSLNPDDIINIIESRLSPELGPVRRYQTLQALLNTTRKQLLPADESTPEQRQVWRDEVKTLEQQGYH